MNEKLLILQVDYEQKNVQEEEIKSRLQMQLREYSEELLALKKQRNELFIERMEKQSQAQKMKMKDKKRGQEKGKSEQVILAGRFEEKPAQERAEQIEEEMRGQTSISNLSSNCRDVRENERSVKCGNKRKGDKEPVDKGAPVTSVDQIWLNGLTSSKRLEDQKSRKWVPSWFGSVNRKKVEKMQTEEEKEEEDICRPEQFEHILE